MDPFFVFLFGVAVGALVGHKATENRWRANADDYRRIESGGTLYKVERSP